MGLRYRTWFQCQVIMIWHFEYESLAQPWHLEAWNFEACQNCYDTFWQYQAVWSALDLGHLFNCHWDQRRREPREEWQKSLLPTSWPPRQPTGPIGAAHAWVAKGETVRTTCWTLLNYLRRVQRAKDLSPTISTRKWVLQETPKNTQLQVLCTRGPRGHMRTKWCSFC